MARYDKYEPMAGGFRAHLAADFPIGDVNKLIGVGMNANGEIVKGGGNSGVIGVLVLTKARKAGEVVDTMTDGEVVEFGGVAGTKYFSDAAGAITATDAPGSVLVGHTVEGNRLIVRVIAVPTAAVTP